MPSSLRSKIQPGSLKRSLRQHRPHRHDASRQGRRTQQGPLARVEGGEGIHDLNRRVGTAASGPIIAHPGRACAPTGRRRGRGARHAVR